MSAYHRLAIFILWTHEIHIDRSQVPGSLIFLWADLHALHGSPAILSDKSGGGGGGPTDLVLLVGPSYVLLGRKYYYSGVAL